jgi:hypothetical protein
VPAVRPPVLPPLAPTLMPPPAAMAPAPMAVAPMQAAPMQAAPMQPPPGYRPWGLPPQGPVGPPPGMQAMYDRHPPDPQHRPSSVPSPRRFARSRRMQLRPWMLVLGALIMALLAFAVTRACIHRATSRPVPVPVVK